MENIDLTNAANELKQLLHNFNSGDWVHDCFEKGKDPDDWGKEFDNGLVEACDEFLDLFNNEEDQENKKNSVNIFLEALNVFLDGIDFKYIEAFKLAVLQQTK